MRRNLRHSGIVAILMMSLIQAWFGHDLLHGHAHHSQQSELGRGHAHPAHESADEATHTKAVRRTDTNVCPELAPVALLIGFCDVCLPDPVEFSHCLDFEIEVRVDPQVLERPHSPRAPPAFSSIV